MAELSGEQKLRIVLESIIRNVPKEEQCKKYGVAEKDFQDWHDHLIKNGGRIFEPEFGQKRERVRKIRKAGPLTKAVLAISLLVNLSGLIVWGVMRYLEETRSPVAMAKEEQIPEIDSPLNQSALEDSKVSQEETESSDVAVGDELLESASIVASKDDPLDLENLLASPLELPAAEMLPPVQPSDLASEVMFLDEVYEGRHVVFLLDAGLYMVDGDGAIPKFEKMKDALLSSIVNLSPNSYFNLLLYWNLREVSSLGKTILRASQENKKYAIDWIAGLGSESETLKENRNQYYPKELLYAKPLPGVVGPWYGLTTAISFDPDLVFVLSGNLPAFSPKEVPRSHYQALGINPSLREIASSAQNETKSTITPLFRETATKWYVSLPTYKAPSNDSQDIEPLALKRLGISEEQEMILSSSQIPWERAFDNFLTGLEVSFDKIPKTHFFLSLPDHSVWPTGLTNTVREFAESSKGSFVVNPNFP